LILCRIFVMTRLYGRKLFSSASFRGRYSLMT
jgi:hypothetical protein